MFFFAIFIAIDSFIRLPTDVPFKLEERSWQSLGTYKHHVSESQVWGIECADASDLSLLHFSYQAV